MSTPMTPRPWADLHFSKNAWRTDTESVGIQVARVAPVVLRFA